MSAIESFLLPPLIDDLTSKNSKVAGLVKKTVQMLRDEYRRGSFTTAKGIEAFYLAAKMAAKVRGKGLAISVSKGTLERAAKVALENHYDEIANRKENPMKKAAKVPKKKIKVGDYVKDNDGTIGYVTFTMHVWDDYAKTYQSKVRDLKTGRVLWRDDKNLVKVKAPKDRKENPMEFRVKIIDDDRKKKYVTNSIGTEFSSDWRTSYLFSSANAAHAIARKLYKMGAQVEKSVSIRKENPMKKKTARRKNGYLADSGAKMYNKENDSGSGFGDFTPAIRKMAAKKLAVQYDEHVHELLTNRKPNPSHLPSPQAEIKAAITEGLKSRYDRLKKVSPTAAKAFLAKVTPKYRPALTRKK